MESVTEGSEIYVQAVILDGERRGEIIRISETNARKWVIDDEEDEAVLLFNQLSEAVEDISKSILEMRREEAVLGQNIETLRTIISEIHRAIETSY